MSMNKTICAHPFSSACIFPSGQVNPCCVWASKSSDLNVNNSNVSQEPRNSPVWHEIREQMLSGQPVKGCEKCYKSESVGGYSGRLFSLEKYTPTENLAAPLDMLEVAFSNLCNLACVGCNDHQSTKWSSENIKAGRHGAKIVDNHFDWSTWDLSKLTQLKILGGEPFMECDRFSELLEKLNLGEITLTVNTNGTVLPNSRLRSLIEQCKEVKLFVSIDGYEQVNDWNRWPGKFSKITSTMKAYQEWWKDYKSINLIAHSVVNIFNIFTIEQLIDYMKSEFSTWHLNFAWIHAPAWQAIQVLPQSVKDELIQKFTPKTVGELKTFFKDDKDFFKVSIGYLNQSSNIQWERVVQQTVSLANERKLNLEAMIPDFARVMDDF